MRGKGERDYNTDVLRLQPVDYGRRVTGEVRVDRLDFGTAVGCLLIHGARRETGWVVGVPSVRVGVPGTGHLRLDPRLVGGDLGRLKTGGPISSQADGMQPQNIKGHFPLMWTLPSSLYDLTRTHFMAEKVLQEDRIVGKLGPGRKDEVL